MPIYEYQCKACGHQFEAVQKFSDTPITVCPECSAKKVEKLISAPSFQLKGSGWYATDFKTKKAPADKEAGGGEKTEKTEKTESTEKKEKTTTTETKKKETKNEA